ncbi:nitroreductase family deazaflavin-dependent oxidoreductase [Mycobacterium ahvazicum]|uniref:Nitroreductase family deazaflavin-dependent oxidoreductase n=1 Tax=Mycobacterium ahvazicum TaxID=1964395 RepID=A0A2K4YI71_9MYCO|nr:nitroreductase family deazaflavin-dependent oxidoreductase [Mycobacterium ahvazicum]SOX56477.1 nitroreductase family deazaflavin-dependent oxidoreductase [Mycobacterium ahvazicum]
MPLPIVDPQRRTTAFTRAMTKFARSGAGKFLAQRIAARTDPWLMRVSHDKVSWGMFAVPSATLHMTGAKTGQPRQAQISYFHDGRDVIAVASNFGGTTHPNWYYNLKAHPECELGGERFLATEVTDPAEYERLYGLAERSYPGYSDYRAATAAIGRHIPVLRLRPRGD